MEGASCFHGAFSHNNTQLWLYHETNTQGRVKQNTAGNRNSGHNSAATTRLQQKQTVLLNPKSKTLI